MSEDQGNQNESTEKDATESNGDQSVEKKPSGAVNHYKQELEKTRLEKERIEKQLEELRVAQLKEKSNFKDLYELEVTKRRDAETKLQSLSSSFVDNLMRKEIEAEALASGIRPEAISDLELVDKGMIETETTSTGKINFLNVKEFVQSLKSTRPYWFKNGEPPKINGALPGNPQFKDLTPAQILELQKKDPAKYNEVMKKRFSK